MNLLNTADLGKWLGFTADGVKQRYYRDPGSLPPAIRIGRSLRWDPEVVAEWLRERTEAPTGIGASQNLAPGANQKAGPCGKR